MERCVRCHGERRSEADLRLNRRRHLFRGDEDLWVVVPGRPDDSLLLELVSLAPDASGHMPEEGEPLTTEQIDLLRRWIAEGADWPAAIDAAADAADERRRATEQLEVPELEGDALAVEVSALERLRELGARAGRIAANTNALEVDVTPIAEQFGDAELRAMTGLGPRLCWLRLSDSKLTDGGLAAVADLRALRRLDLSGTSITSAGITKLATLPELRHLDLHRTAVDDASIDALLQIPMLTQVNLWATRVTEAGVERLRGARPELRVERGRAADRIRETPPADRGADR
jgi:hypothetical protein